jgi:hypothetical protein
MMEIGSKVQVYRGLAHKTSGGLMKKDIVKIVDKYNVTRYKSLKQQQKGQRKKVKSQKARSKWTDAFRKAIAQLRSVDPYYEKNILMSKRRTRGKEKANDLYKLTMEYYNGK